jgi:hypothetical protein
MAYTCSWNSLTIPSIHPASAKKLIEHYRGKWLVLTATCAQIIAHPGQTRTAGE